MSQSNSLGQSGVYLLGTSDPMATPIPITLNHGDIVVMSGPSRLAYHAVPKIIKTTESETLLGGVDVDGVFDRLVELTGSQVAADIILKYLQCSRININMRQVVDAGQDFPTNNNTDNGDAACCNRSHCAK